MSKRIETEKKYYCFDTEKLIDKINSLKLKLVSSGHEKDEYFTDINSEYIRNRTCLRIRNKDNKELEITFKGKSLDLSNTYSKIESNFDLNIDNYESIVNLFSALGYYSYTIVNKNRQTYTVEEQDYKYSVMVDTIEDLGGFVEFELLCYKEEYDEDELREKLSNFISMFDSLKLEEAKLPYRDFVAIKKYEDILPKKDIKGVHINLDYYLNSYEKDFFKFYQKACNDSTKEIIKWGTYKGNNISDEIVNPELDNKLNKYFETLKIKDSNILLFTKLIKELKNKDLDVILSTKCNKLFISNLLGRIMSLEDFKSIIYLNTRGSIFTELKSHKINLENYFNIISKDIKETNSEILIIINNRL